MTVKLPIDMPKECWSCKFAQKDLIHDRTTCLLIYLFRHDIWEPPYFIQKGKKDTECPLIEAEDDNNDR